jgi:MoxR-like ATPase
MPSDVIGTTVFNMNSSAFTFNAGPVFSNLVLIDEINRSPAKTQAALFEVMEENQVTVDGTTHKMGFPFFVIATQNPIEQEGTYPLPEAQTDRFMLKVKVGYPTKEEERQIMRLNLSGDSFQQVEKVVDFQEIMKARESIKEIYMDEKIEQYILDIVFATRQPENYRLSRLKPLINYGGSPRATINLAKAAKAYAFIKRRGYVIPEDIRAICHDVMRHRIGLSYEAEAENISQEDIINEILNAVEIP